MHKFYFLFTRIFITSQDQLTIFFQLVTLSKYKNMSSVKNSLNLVKS